MLRNLVRRRPLTIFRLGHRESRYSSRAKNYGFTPNVALFRNLSSCIQAWIHREYAAHQVKREQASIASVWFQL